MPLKLSAEHIDFLSRKYNGERWDPVPGQTRVIVRLLPEHIRTAD